MPNLVTQKASLDDYSYSGTELFMTNDVLTPPTDL
jgi:hypothetical protein